MAGVAGLVVASSAHAAAPAGGRAEAIVGWDKNKLDTGAGTLNRDGVVFGLGLGYDFVIGTTASLGIDVEASESSADVSATSGTTSAKLSIGRDLYAGARATFALSDRANLYFKAGYTNARVKGSVTLAGTTTSASANADGIRGGAGVQFMLSSKMYVGGEYRYSNYENDYSRHQVVGTVGFRF
ncbi:MAG: porin family protein [Proteobacteria bacterium]|nr:porin family protein [Pseudomonadota bacterium]